MRRALPEIWFGMIAKRTIRNRERKRSKKRVGSSSKAPARTLSRLVWSALDKARRSRRVATVREQERMSMHSSIIYAISSMRRAGDFPESASYGSPISASRADLSRRAIPRRRPFCATSTPNEWPVLRGEPQIETAIWRRSTWIDERLCFCAAEDGFTRFIRDDRGPDESFGG